MRADEGVEVKLRVIDFNLLWGYCRSCFGEPIDTLKEVEMLVD
jgi:hypothetical protein